MLGSVRPRESSTTYLRFIFIQEQGCSTLKLRREWVTRAKFKVRAGFVGKSDEVCGREEVWKMVLVLKERETVNGLVRDQRVVGRD